MLHRNINASATVGNASDIPQFPSNFSGVHRDSFPQMRYAAAHKAGESFG